MKTNILLTMALMACMMLAGCSKDESSEETRKGNDMEQTLTKEQIVGVWRSGDYWVSFSSDGYMSAYLSDKCIAEGDYTIDGDTVKVDDGTKRVRALGKNTRLVINSISNGTLSLTATYNNMQLIWDGDEGLVHLLTQDYSFSKTQDAPCTKSNPLVGKTCVLPMDVWYFKGFGPDGSMVSTPGTCTVNIEKYNRMNVQLRPTIDDGYNAGDVIHYLYVYLPPKLYMISIEAYGGRYERKRPIKIYEPTFDADGSLTIPYTYPDDIENYL